ncbi:hypothetical protein ADK58_21850 [Streptomyces sp. XY152]|nr:hypothetical protein ADK58_21850 [Streptomyces sp. XY152]
MRDGRVVVLIRRQVTKPFTVTAVQMTVLARGHHRSCPRSPRLRLPIQLAAQLTARIRAGHLAHCQVHMVHRARASCRPRSSC